MMSQDSTPGSLVLYLITKPLPVAAGLSLSGCQWPLFFAPSYGSSGAHVHPAHTPASLRHLAGAWPPWKPHQQRGETLLGTTEQISLPVAFWNAYIAHILLVEDRETVTQVAHPSARGNEDPLITEDLQSSP